MKNAKLAVSLLLALSVQAVLAVSPRHNDSQIFVKMVEGQTLSKSELISEVKPLFDDLYLVKTTSADKLISTLKNDPSVEYTERDSYAGAQAMPELKNSAFPKSMAAFVDGFNDPKISQLWAFDSASKHGMSVLDAYKQLPATTPEEVIVAVVDTGVEYTHSDLKDIMWKNDGEIPGDGIDNDGNGYIDDVYGINTLIRDARGNATTNPMASHWHGTHVSGTIAATQNNRNGIAGVASNVKIMAIRTVPDNADELDSNIVEAFLYAAKNGAKLINCSFGKNVNEGGMVVKETIDHIGKKYGVLVVASAGNDSHDTYQQNGGCIGWCNNDTRLKYPSSFETEYMIVVASTTNRGVFSEFSNLGPKSVDIAAPGSDIYSTITGNSYKSASGTSMASPNTTGVLAMILGYNPTLSPVQLKKLAMDTATPVAAFKGQIVSGGRIDLLKALQKTKTIKK